MKGKAQWAVSSNGPDWTDIAATMKAVEGFHSVLITFSIGTGVYDGPALFGTVSACSMPVEGSVLGQPIMAIALEYPCKDHKDLTACVYAALLQLDFMLTEKVWDQLKLPFTGS